MFESDKSDSSSIRSLAIGSIPGGDVAITAAAAAWTELAWPSLSYNLEKESWIYSCIVRSCCSLPVNPGEEVGRVLPRQTNSDHVVAGVSCLCLAPAEVDNVTICMSINYKCI